MSMINAVLYTPSASDPNVGIINCAVQTLEESLIKKGRLYVKTDAFDPSVCTTHTVDIANKVIVANPPPPATPSATT